MRIGKTPGRVRICLLFALVLSGSTSFAAQQPPLDLQLIEACLAGNAEQVAELLERGANPNTVRSGGLTVLHWAAKHGHVKVMRLLIDRGADVNARASDGRFTPLVEAASALEPAAVKMLLDAGAKTDGFELGMACWLGRVETAKLLLDAGVSPDAGMAEAAQGGHVEVLRLLLDRGADANAKSRDGSTALHTGALQGGLKVVEVLLSAGGDPNAINAEGETPLHRAVSGDRDLARVRALVKAGARLDVANNKGQTPVRLAAMYGSKPIYDWLVESNGGREPTPAARRAEPGDKSTRELVAALVSVKPQERSTIQRELVARGGEVVPEVMRSIETGTSIEHFYEIFAALGEKADASVPAITRQLSDKSHAFMALITLERIRPGSIDDLPEGTKRAAAEALRESVESADQGMMASFSNDLLARIGKPAAASLLRLMRHPNSEQRRRAIGALKNAKFLDEEITAELVKLLRDESLHVRSAAARALGTFGEASPEVRVALLSILKDAPPYALQEKDERKFLRHREWRTVADDAARSLGRFGPAIIDDLLPLLSPLDAPERQPAVASLVSVSVPGVPRLIELCAHEDRSIAISASVALNRIGPSAVPQLAAAVRTGDEQTVQYVSSALWWIGGGAMEALPALFEVAGNEQRLDVVRVAAARAAIKISPARSRESESILSVIPALIRLLEHGSFQQQGAAAETASGIGPAARETLPALRKRLELPGPEVDTEGLVRSYVQGEAKRAISTIEAVTDAAKAP